MLQVTFALMGLVSAGVTVLICAALLTETPIAEWL